MDKNPYEAPTHEEELVLVADRARRSKFDWLFVPLGWAVLLFIFWTQHGIFSDFQSDIPTWAKIASTILTSASIVVLVFSIRGWRLFIALPLLGYMVWIQYLVWTFYAGR